MMLIRIWGEKGSVLGGEHPQHLFSVPGPEARVDREGLVLTKVSTIFGL